MKTVFITAAGGEIANPVIKALRMMEEDVRIIGADASPYSCGLYRVEKAFLVPRVSDTGNYKKAVVGIIQKEKVDLLIPGSDTELPLLSLMNDNGELPCKAVVASHEAVIKTYDKLETYEFFKVHGLPFATTVKREGLDELIEEYGFPIVAKPGSGSGSIGIKVFFNRRELEDADLPDSYIYQELVTGKDKGSLERNDVVANGSPVQRDEISTQLYISKKGRVLGIFTSINNLKNGMPVFVRPVRLTKHEETISKMALKLAEIGLRGPVNFQSKTNIGGFKVFEINMRFTGITGSRSTIGYNECEAAVKEYLHDADEEEIKKSFSTDYGKCILRHYEDIIAEQADVREFEEQMKDRWWNE